MRLRSTPLLWILVLCVIVRLGVLVAFPQVFAFDQTGAVQGSDAYDYYARNLLTTGIYGRTAGIPDAVVPPLYGYILAGVYAIFGRGYIQVGLFHILLDVLSIAMLYEIGRRLMPEGKFVGLVGGLLYALYPYLIFQNLTLIDTPLFMTLLFAFILLVVRLRQCDPQDRTKWLWAILGGIVLGLAVLTRPVIVPLAGFVTIWFLFRLNLRDSFLRLLPVAVCSLLIVLPWTVRNYGVFHAMAPVSTNSGMNFWFGNSEYTIPFLRAGYHTQWAKRDKTGVPADVRLADAQLMQISLQFLRDNPGKIPELLWVKFLAYWSIDVFPTKNPANGQLLAADSNGIIRVASSEDSLTIHGVSDSDPVATYSQPLFDRIGRLVHIIYFGSLLVLALIGIALTVKERRDVSLLWFVQIGMTLVYVIFVPATRYRVPTDPLLFLFSAYTVVQIAIAIRRPRAVQVMQS